MATRALLTVALVAETRALLLHAQAPPLKSLHAPRSSHLHASLSLSGVLSGTLALPAASGIAAAAGTLAYVRQAYIFSLSYGLAMGGIGGAVLLASPTSRLVQAHAALVAGYGVRLFAFLLWRQRFQPGYDGLARLRALDKTPKIQRTPIILSTALFYGLMSSPLLWHFQSAPLLGSAATFSAAGCVLAALALAYEAIADLQKSLHKMSLRAANKPDELCTGGLYASSRHANYLGEVAFWVASFLTGLPAVFAAGVPLYARALRALSSGLGLAGIVFIMLSATKRLEGVHAQKYRKVGGIPTSRYDAYYASSNALMPKLF